MRVCADASGDGECEITAAKSPRLESLRALFAGEGCGVGLLFGGLCGCGFGWGGLGGGGLWGGGDVVLDGLGDAELDDGLGLDLDGFAGLGLRPRRALRSALTSLPMPGMVNSPFFLVSLTAVSARVSRKVETCLLLSSSFSAMVRMRTVLVMPFAIVDAAPSVWIVLSFSGSALSWLRNRQCS